MWKLNDFVWTLTDVQANIISIDVYNLKFTWKLLFEEVADSSENFEKSNRNTIAMLISIEWIIYFVLCFQIYACVPSEWVKAKQKLQYSP